jgi:hypothetical protein
MQITKTEHHVILEKESELEMFYLGKLAGLTSNSNYEIVDGVNFRLIIPEKDFINAIIQILAKV